MTLFTNILAGLLLLVTGLSVAQTSASEVAGKSVPILSQAAREGDWLSYRDAYRSMLPFEKYGKAKNLLQNHYQISPKDKSGSTDAVSLILQSKSIRLNLSLDATGRTVLPLLKLAYDENAELVLTQKMNQKVNQFRFRSRISIVVRPDGVYETSDLREACEQALAYQNYLDASVLRGRKCVGVRFVYPKNNLETVVEFRQATGNAQALPVHDGAAFWGESNENFRTMTYLFSSWPEKGQVVTRSAPIVISAQFD
jgi:hypothetical protein